MPAGWRHPEEKEKAARWLPTCCRAVFLLQSGSPQSDENPAHLFPPCGQTTMRCWGRSLNISHQRSLKERPRPPGVCNSACEAIQKAIQDRIRVREMKKKAARTTNVTVASGGSPPVRKNIFSHVSSNSVPDVSGVSLECFSVLFCSRNSFRGPFFDGVSFTL